MAAVTLSGNFYMTTAPVAQITTTQINDGSYTTIEIVGSQVEHNHQKTLKTDIQIPILFANQPRSGGANTPTTYLIDLLRLKEEINVTGFLHDSSTESAFTKKSNILTIIKRGGTFSIVWGTGSSQEKYVVNVTKSSIKEVPETYSDSGDHNAAIAVRGYSVVLQFIVGTDRGG